MPQIVGGARQSRRCTRTDVHTLALWGPGHCGASGNAGVLAGTGDVCRAHRVCGRALHRLHLRCRGERRSLDESAPACEVTSSETGRGYHCLSLYLYHCLSSQALVHVAAAAHRILWVG